MAVEFISQSMAGQFQRCPAQFEWRWIRGVVIPPGIAARRGSGVHKAAAVNHLQKIQSKVDCELDVMQDAARDEYMRLVKDEGVFIPEAQTTEKNKLLAAGLDAAVRLTELYANTLAPQIQPVMAEERLTVDVGLSVPIAGTVDVLTEDDWLPDLKTADKSKSASEADTSLQLTMYAGLVAQKIKRWPKKVSLEVLVNTKEPKLQSLQAQRGPDDWKNLLVRLELILKQIELGLFPPCDPGAWICTPTWCGYYQICRYSMKRRNL